MYIAGQRIRARLTLRPRCLLFLLLLFCLFLQSVPSFFLNPALGRADSLSTIKPAFAAYDDQPSLLSNLTLPYLPTVYLSPSSASTTLLTVDPFLSVPASLWQTRLGFCQRHIPYIVTFAAHWPSFSKYYRFPIIGAGWEQLWRVLITYSISRQPV